MRTYWAAIGIDNLAGARENLAKREGTDIRNVAFWTRDNQLATNCTNEVEKTMSGWLEGRNNIDAVIWTNLESNFEQRERRAFSAENALAYVLGLQSDTAKRNVYQRAREYVQNAPAAVQTEVRELLRTRASINDATLPEVLFET